MDTASTEKKSGSTGIPSRMQKRVETKDDGRLIIYYTFDSTKVAKKEGAQS
jgi:hypothetical protein